MLSVRMYLLLIQQTVKPYFFIKKKQEITRDTFILPSSFMHTQTHTHKERDRERDREREGEIKSPVSFTSEDSTLI